jgi:hypothetical protein
LAQTKNPLKVGDKVHEGLSYMAKVMPVNEYRASWLLEVIFDSSSKTSFSY